MEEVYSPWSFPLAPVLKKNSREVRWAIAHPRMNAIPREDISSHNCRHVPQDKGWPIRDLGTDDHESLPFGCFLFSPQLRRPWLTAEEHLRQVAWSHTTSGEVYVAGRQPPPGQFSSPWARDGQDAVGASTKEEPQRNPMGCSLPEEKRGQEGRGLPLLEHSGPPLSVSLWVRSPLP